MRTSTRKVQWGSARSIVFGLTAAFIAAMVLPACGQSDDQAGPSTTSTTATTKPSTSSTTPAAKTPLTVYFMRNEKLVAVHRQVPRTTAVAKAALTALLEGPTADERDHGIASAIPTGTVLNGVIIDGGLATVDLSKTYESGGGSLSMASRLAQVVFTATQFPSVQRVEFRLDGEKVSVFGGEGLILDHPTERANFEELLPAILVDSPAWSETVSSPVRVRGTANVFEAVFRVEIRDSDGRIVANRSVMASSGTGTRGTFDVTLSYSAPQTGNGAVIVSSESPKDGSRINVIETPVTVNRSS